MQYSEQQIDGNNSAVARPLAGLENVCSCLFNETISQCVSPPPTGWPHDHGPIMAMVKKSDCVQNCCVDL